MRFFFSSQNVGWWAFGFTFLLILWGNLVAGFEAGLGCPDWPLCYGRVIPPYSRETYLEFLHRILGGIAGVFILLLIYYRIKEYKGKAKIFPWVLLGIFLIQVVLGGVVVLLRLPPSLIILHFFLALMVFLGVLYLAVFAPSRREPQFSLQGRSLLYFLFLILMILQLLSGAFVRHYQAGLACGREFPLCLGEWFPISYSFPTLLHLIHRYMAYSIVLVVLFFLFLSKGKERKIWGIYLFLLLLQISIAVGVIHTQLSPWMVFFHMLLALTLLVGAFHMYTYSLRRK